MSYPVKKATESPYPKTDGIGSPKIGSPKTPDRPLPNLPPFSPLIRPKERSHSFTNAGSSLEKTIEVQKNIIPTQMFSHVLPEKVQTWVPISGPKDSKSTDQRKRSNTLSKLKQLKNAWVNSEGKSDSQITSNSSHSNPSPVTAQKNKVPLTSEVLKTLTQKYLTSRQSCNESLQSISGFQNITDELYRKENSELQFLLSASEAHTASVLQNLYTNQLKKLQEAIVKSNFHETYIKDCNERKSRFAEFKDKMMEFFMQMEALRKEIECTETQIVASQKGNSQILQKEKKAIVEELSAFLGFIEYSVLKQKLEAFEKIMYSDKGVVEETFVALHEYFAKLASLTDIFFKNLEKYVHYSVKKNGAESKINERNTSDYLNFIPREISQYNDLFKKLTETSEKILQWRLQNKLPHTIEFLVHNKFSELQKLLKQKQSEINQLTNRYSIDLTG